MYISQTIYIIFPFLEVFPPVGQFRVKLPVRHADLGLELLRGFPLAGLPLRLELDVKVVRGLHLSEQL